MVVPVVPVVPVVVVSSCRTTSVQVILLLLLYTTVSGVGGNIEWWYGGKEQWPTILGLTGANGNLIIFGNFSSVDGHGGWSLSLESQGCIEVNGLVLYGNTTMWSYGSWTGLNSNMEGIITAFNFNIEGPSPPADHIFV
jgi:hypothetical protein